MNENNGWFTKTVSGWNAFFDSQGRESVSPGLADDRPILNIIGKFSVELIGIPTAEELAWYVAREVVGALGFTDCVVYYLSDEEKVLRQVAAFGESKTTSSNEIVDPLTIPVGTGITGYVAETGEPVSVDDLTKDQRYIPDVNPARSELCVPLIIDERVVGVLDCEDHRVAHFKGGHQEILVTVAAVMSAKLKLLEQAETVEAAIRRSEEQSRKLQASEHHFQILFDNTAIGIGRSRVSDGRIVLANVKLAEMLGYDSVEALKERHDFTTSYEDSNQRARMIEAFENDPVHVSEQTHTLPDGSSIAILVYDRINREEGFIDFLAVDISKLKQSDRIKQEQENVIHALIENAPIPISVKDLTGAYIYVSPAYTYYLGVEAEAAVGMRAEDLLPKEAADLLKQSDETIIRTGKALAPAEAFTVVFNESTLQVTKFPIKDESGSVTGICTIGMDVTEEIKAKRDLSVQRDMLQQAEEIATLGHWMWTENGERLVYCSDQAARIFGMTVPDMLSAAGSYDSFVSLVHEDDRERLGLEIKSFHELVRQKSDEAWGFKVDYRIYGPDGLIRNVREIMNPAQHVGDETLSIGTVQDITEQKKTEQQLIQSSKLAMLGEMASGIAHELNQPLSIIRMASENSLAGIEEGSYDTERLKDRLLGVVEQSDRMASIINYMRMFSRNSTSSHEPFDVNDAINRATGLLENQLKVSGIGLNVDLEAHCPPSQGDSLHLEQVLLNLLNNAQDASLTFMDTRIDEDREWQANISITSRYDEALKGIRILVEDNAGGIPDNVLPKIFDPFFTTKPIGSGTGLGLSISHSLINGMGGYMTVRQKDDGTCFGINLPVYDDALSGAEGTARQVLPAKEENKMNVNEHRELTATENREYSVLLVDDEPIAAQSMSEYLERKGFRTHVASNGKDAMVVFDSNAIDVVVTDLRMPEMDGNELVHCIRMRNQGIPIIVATGHTTLGDEQEIVSEGATAVMRKPLRLKELTDLLTKLVTVGEISCPDH